MGLWLVGISQISADMGCRVDGMESRVSVRVSSMNYSSLCLITIPRRAWWTIELGPGVYCDSTGCITTSGCEREISMSDLNRAII